MYFKLNTKQYISQSSSVPQLMNQISRFQSNYIHRNSRPGAVYCTMSLTYPSPISKEIRPQSLWYLIWLVFNVKIKNIHNTEILVIFPQYMVPQLVLVLIRLSLLQKITVLDSTAPGNHVLGIIQIHLRNLFSILRDILS